LSVAFVEREITILRQSRLSYHYLSATYKIPSSTVLSQLTP